MSGPVARRSSVHTFFSPAEVEAAAVSDATAVVIDVIRATSTIVEALAAGAKGIYPTLSTEEALRLATSLGREDTLLCGERRGLKIGGFDLGNSPREFTPDQVRGRRLVMTTTNGTRAFLAAQGAGRILALSLMNLSAAAASVRGTERITVICAGKEERFSMDDALCAGIFLLEVLGPTEARGGVDLNDQSRAALTLAEAHLPDEAFLRETAAGAALVEIGLGDDLALCAERDRHSFVPEMYDRVIRLPSAGA
jgi:2-phosphosulfolactate phosphatase